MNEAHRNRALLWSLLAGFVLVSLFVLGVRTLVPPDEGRYAEMAREMFTSGDWITTRLNGIKYFEKPPLQTWMNALTFTVFGVGEWQARLWTGLCGIFGVLMTGYAGMRVYGARVGLYAALVLASSFYWIACSQINSLDMGLSGMMTLALCALLIAQRDAATPRERRNWMLVCWAGMALAVLSKGLIGLVLPGGVLVCYTLLARDWRLWTRLHIVKGLLVFLAIAAPWFVLVGLKNPEQPHFFFIHEHFDRFLKKEHHREAGWWMFLALLAAGCVPWLGVLLQSLVQGAKRVDKQQFRPGLLALVWLVFILAFFTNSESKLPGYLLPVFPAAALLIGYYLDVGARRNHLINAGMMLGLGALLLALVPFMTRLGAHTSEQGLFKLYQPWVLAAGCVALLGGCVTLVLLRRDRRDLAIVALAIAGFGTTHLMLAGYEPIGQARAGAQMLPAIQAELTPATTIYAVGMYEQSMTFYLARPVVLVAYLDEFEFGLQHEPHRAIPDVHVFLAQWRAHTKAGVKDIAITSAYVAREMQRGGEPVRIVAADARRTVIANF
jgi:4-amino-4-deoxy-L-arabinose transferase-like glycosyltransferase